MPPMSKPNYYGEKMAERKPLPERTVFSIEYPGYVNNVEKAILTLGGPERLVRHATSEIEEEGPVELRFRYNDPASHAIIGDKAGTKNLLVKVTKRTRRLKSATGEVVGPVEVVRENAEIVAVIDKTARFRRLADFQVIVPKGDPLVQIAKALSKVDIDEAKRLAECGVLDASLNAASGYIPSPSIDILGYSSQLPVKDIFGAARPTVSNENGGENKVSKRPASRFNKIIISYDSPTIPTKPTPQALEAIEDIPQELIERARAILAEAPVVSRNAMELLIPQNERHGFNLATIMFSMAYLMQNGAWRSCWIRFGYDPREDKEAYKYQIVDMRRKSNAVTSGRPRILQRGAQVQKQKQEPKQVPEQSTEDHVPRNAIEA
ncbi:tau 95 subunit of transcription factor TFIIIC, partial [Coemansia aciculifera]